MYLALLNEKEKELFLGLAYNLAYIDGNYSDKEQKLINEYCQEMQIQFDAEKMVKPVVDIISAINEMSNDRIKKIFLLELIGLAMIDGNYDDSEKKIVYKVGKEFDLEMDFVSRCENVLSEYISFQERMNQLIFG